MTFFIKLLHLRGLRNKINMWLVNHLFVGTSNKWFRVKRNLLNSIDGFSIGLDTKIVGPIYSSANLTIGDKCWVGKNFCCNGSGSVTIGNNCDIAPEVIINTGGHIVGGKERRAGQGIINDVSIGNGCWLCARSTIVNNTNVGDGCVVLPGACVVKDVQPNSMVGGVPARVIKMLD